jgi:predicted Zn-dependent protease
MKSKKRFVLAFTVLLVSAACFGMSGCRTPCFNNGITPEQEKTIGDWAAAQIQSESIGPIDPSVLKDVSTITMRLNAEVTTPPRILISDSDTYTVSSLPGGWLVISAKTVILMKGNPNALAGLLAHEYAHIEHDDALKKITGAVGSENLVNLTTQGKYTDTSNIAVQLTNLGNSFKDEYSADAEGVRIAASAGYDPNGILSAIAMLQAVSPTTDAEWLIVHPVSALRLKLLNNDVAAYANKQKT